MEKVEARGLYKIFGTNIFYVGKVGKASALKLALNQLIASLTAAFSVSLSYVQKNEIDSELFMDILRKSALYAPTFDKKLANYESQNFDKTNFGCRKCQSLRQNFYLIFF